MLGRLHVYKLFLDWKQNSDFHFGEDGLISILKSIEKSLKLLHIGGPGLGRAHLMHNLIHNLHSVCPNLEMLAAESYVISFEFFESYLKEKTSSSEGCQMLKVLEWCGHNAKERMIRLKTYVDMVPGDEDFVRIPDY